MSRIYGTVELLEAIKKADGYEGIPNEYYLVGIRSKEDKPDNFDDLIYLMNGEQPIMMFHATTHTGVYGLKNFKLWNSKGAAVLKSNQWHHNIWSEGLHKGKMRALVQVNKAYLYRDNNMNDKVEEIGQLYFERAGINFHTVSYNKFTNFIAKLIGQWSVGCVVVPDVEKYYNCLDTIPKEQKFVSLVIINEQ